MKTGSDYAYARVEKHLQGMIEQGTLRVGDRIPSIRELCRTERVSPSTVIQALSNLEAKSLILARPRSGYYVRPQDRLPVPAPAVPAHRPLRPTISEPVADVFASVARTELVPLGAALPDASLLPVEALARAAARRARLSAVEFARYAMGDRDLPLRRELARRLAARGCEAPPEEIILTIGCMEALNLALRAVAAPGDTILVESPTFYGLLQVIASLGMRVVTVPSSCGEGISPAALERALQQFKVAACVLIPTYGNPHGACLPEARRRQAVAMLARRGVPLIEDDIYGELGFDADQPRPMKAFDESGDVLLCGSLSKSLAPGLRTGWIAAGRHAEDVRRTKWITSVAMPHVTVETAAEYLRSGGYDRHLRRFRSHLETSLSRFSQEVAASFPPGTAMSRPRGGYFLWVELPWRVEAMELYREALRQGISVCPGPIFSAEEEFSHYIRLNAAVPWSEPIRQAIRTLGHIATRLAEAPREEDQTG